MALRGDTRIGLIEQTIAARNRHARCRTFRSAFFVLCLGLGVSSCSWSWQLGSLMPDDGDITGSIKPRQATPASAPLPAPSPLSPLLNVEDWRRAKAAMSVALDIQGNGKPVNWDNPDSGLKGAITPAGAPFVDKDDICRSFQADIHGKAVADSTLQGVACKNGPDEWLIKDVQPVKKSA